MRTLDSPLRRRLVDAHLLAMLLSPTSCHLSDKPAPVQDAGESAAPESLQPAAEALLRGRMQRHGDQMNALMSTVAVLDWEGAERATRRLLEEPQIAPPGIAGDVYNASFPATFFVQQQTMLSALHELEAAIAQRSDRALKVAFNGVANACIDCHASFLRGARRPNIFVQGDAGRDAHGCHADPSRARNVCE